MFEGVYTALVTPFSEDGQIDDTCLRNLVEFQISQGVQGLVPMGTTGESPTVSHSEHIEIIRIVVDQCRGRVPVIAGAGSNSTDEAVGLSERAKELGAQATLHVSPYYNKPTQEGLYRHYWSVAERVDIPLIVYNIPGRSGVNISNDTMLRLSEHRNIVGVKEATGNLAQAMDLICRKPESLTVLSGDDNMSFPLIALGGKGVISVASNLLPGEMSRFIGLALKGKMNEALKIHYRLLPLFQALFIETNPIPIKAAMAMKGMLKEVYRLPMCPMSEKNRETLQRILKELKVL